MRKEDGKKTAFVTELGLFQYNCLYFGLINTPSIFTQCMNQLLNGASEFVTAYLDDIICYSPDFATHLIHLHNLFDIIRKARMKLQKSKCSFFCKKVKYLGHVVTKDNILPDPYKVKCILELTQPTSIKGVRSPIRMTSYYHRYIPKICRDSIFFD